MSTEPDDAPTTDAAPGPDPDAHRVAADRPHPAGYRRVGENRYREQVGFHYDEIVVGTVIEHRPGRTVTEMDNVLMSMLSMNASPLHIDDAYATRGRWGRPLVSSLVTLSIVGGMTARSTSGRAIANLGWDRIRLSHPVFVGDTLYAESEVTGKRLSASRPGEGIVSCRTTGLKATGEVVITFERSFLLPTHRTRTDHRTGY
ncbi:MaoC family dehydratase [Micromonospora cathayae]|uniref:MaoC family dehydratase n=1 Tax=Micromonospora cathayae TaxID=3028804 RepID=A0ABY7ZN83_9ACTN|nr:MaoC family dehydratase [Micromonospora sp. HUAS 3]WDZ83891.1 MaoC family dehydratase [Micromonospora sp. HUAS 3]